MSEDVDRSAATDKFEGPGLLSWISFIFAIGFAGLLVGLVLTLDSPSVLVSGELETESAEIRVLNPDQMILEIPLASTVMEGSDVCASNVRISVERGAEVFLTLQPDGSLVVATGGETNWSSDLSSAQIVEPEGAYFLVASSSEQCAWRGTLRLPIVGELTAGMTASGEISPAELRPLLSGRLTIHGRATERVFGFVPLSLFAAFTPIEPGKLFNAGAYNIPAGSRLEGGSARFAGFADVQIVSPETALPGEGMILHVSTNARELSIFAPSPRLSNQTKGGAPPTLLADTISMTFGARLANDPNLHVIFGGISALILIVGLLGRFLPKRRIQE
jgi:hypothetical protein|tara:strand:- start:392444 stop:393442 length:999 start_codon:yes stop_codon:yes gene_type:complete